LIAGRGVLSAQEVYTLGMCRDTALKYNHAVLVAAGEEARARHESRAYFSRFLPEVSASGGYLYTTARLDRRLEEAYLPLYLPDPATGQLRPDVMLRPDGQPVIGADGNPVFNRYAYFPGLDARLRPNNTCFAGVSVEQPLFAGGKIVAAYKMSRVGRDIAALNARRARAEVIVATDEAYWLHVKALETKTVALAFARVAGELLRDVRDAVETGMRTRNDLLKVQVQANRAALQLQKAENAIRLSRLNLCRVMGLPLTTHLEVARELDEEARPLLPAGAAIRPEYTLLEKQVELKGEAVRLARADFLPRVGVSVTYGYARGPEFNGAPLVDKASFSALLSVKIPIFHWGEGVNKARAARNEKQVMAWQRDEWAGKMELEKQQALAALEESRVEERVNALALEQAEENMKVARDRHEVGMETLAGYLEAQTLWQEAALALLESRVARCLNETYYLKATGAL
jgi:outer membrane protein TolC